MQKENKNVLNEWMNAIAPLSWAQMCGLGSTQNLQLLLSHVASSL